MRNNMLVEMTGERRKCWDAWMNYYKSNDIKVTALERTNAFLKSGEYEYPKY